ncbi:hypothetical protein AB5J62_38030 [Amycolatopsis sp. cg5]|uniref:hypothetical protein n=1 Tax=Amycolatopsis sp. cg5 TaxID=3238802 RepID=UPI00352554AD
MVRHANRDRHNAGAAEASCGHGEEIGGGAAVLIVETPDSVTVEVYWPDKALNGVLTASVSTSRFWSGGPPLARVPLDPFAAAAIAADLTRY